MKELFNVGSLLEAKNNSKPLKKYRKLINLVHFNPKSSSLFLSFLDLSLFLVLDIKTSSISWVLPAITNELPLACVSDLDKLVVAYDSNRIAVFDLNNKRLHDWTKQNLERFPNNFLSRFNRIVGIV